MIRFMLKTILLFFFVILSLASNAQFPYYGVRSSGSTSKAKNTSHDESYYGCSESHGHSGNGTYRQAYNDGSYADITKNEDGTTTSVLHSKCNSCKGSARCTICNGTGQVVSGWGRYSRVLKCSFCGMSGRCIYCNGSGEVVTVNQYNPRTKSTEGYSVSMGKKFNTVDGKRKSNNRYAKEKYTCKTCRGTGVDPFPWKDASSNAGQNLPWCYTSEDGSICLYCSERVWHQHHKCESCNIK